jgi:hypothetical protein
MRDRFLVSLGSVAAVVIAVVWLAPVPVAGQAAAGAAKTTGANAGTLPRTPWGDPDLQGMWETQARTPMERPSEFGAREFMTEAEAADRARRGLDAGGGDDDEGANPANLAQADVKRNAAATSGDQSRPGYRIAGNEYNSFWSAAASVTKRKASLRTSQVVDPPDGRIPPLTREALTRWEARDEARRGRSQADDWEDRGLSERCIVRNGLPAEMLGDAQQPVKEIVQSPGFVTFVMPYGYIRMIPLDGRPHVGSAIRLWNGDARGHWEGNTLVVETTNFHDTVNTAVPGHGGPFGGSAHFHYYPGTGETLRLTERFTRIDPETIEYRYTVDDPKVFVRPWTTVNSWSLDSWSVDGKQDRIFEYACHEHNYGMVNALKGARANPQGALDEAAREAALRQKERQAKWEQLKKWEESHKSGR